MMSESGSDIGLEDLPGLFNFSRSEEGFSEYYFSETCHALGLLQGLNKQREEGVLCDVIISVEQHEFPCHRNVLAACSPYFLAMFSGEMRESYNLKVPIVGIDASIMKQLIDYAYTSDIVINQDNAQHLLSAANLIQMNSIRDACCRFLEREMEPSNCLGIHCFADAHTCSLLSERAKEYALKNFSEVAEHDEIKLLPNEKLIEFLRLDDLNVESEEVVFQAVIEWLNYDPDKRISQLAEVLKYVRLPLVSPYFLFDKVDSEPLLTELPDCRALIDEAKKFVILKDRHRELESARTKPRTCQAISYVLMTIGGEIYNKNYLNSVDCYKLDEGEWMKLKDLPFPRCHHGAVLSQGKHVYVAGGFNKDKVVLNHVMRYEVSLDKWIKVACMNTQRARHGMAVLDGYIYAVGGCDGQTRINSVERYDPDANIWTFVNSMPVAVSRCQAASLHGYLYVAGGTTEPNNQCVDLMQRYNPKTDSWEMLSPMPVQRCLAGLVSLNNQLYAVAGTELAMANASRRLSRYDPEKNQWTECAELVESRFDAGVAVHANRIYVLSGHDGENSFYHSIEQYDSDTDRWTLLHTTMPYGRCRFGSVALGMR